MPAPALEAKQRTQRQEPSLAGSNIKPFSYSGVFVLAADASRRLRLRLRLQAPGAAHPRGLAFLA